MPSWSSRHFKIETRVGTNTAASVSLSCGRADPHEVVITPLSGLPKPTKLSCVRANGTAASYDPAPPDAWDHDFGSIDRSTTIDVRTASRTVQAGQTTGTAVLRVNQLEVDDGLPPPRVHAVGVDISVSVT